MHSRTTFDTKERANYQILQFAIMFYKRLYWNVTTIAQVIIFFKEDAWPLTSFELKLRLDLNLINKFRAASQNVEYIPDFKPALKLHHLIS